MKIIKTLLSFLLLLTVSLAASAQVPSQFNYQAVLRDDAGQVMENIPVEIEIAILQASAEGPVVFSEIHQVQTNTMGLVNLQIGSVNNLNDIDWGNDSYFLRLSIDGELMGVSQLLSVPFALHAGTSADSFSGDYHDLENTPALDDFIEIENPQDGDMIFFNGDMWLRIPIGNEGQILAYKQGMVQWVDIPEDGDNGWEDQPGTVTDVDGNVYSTVQIGYQEWMAENLRVSRYNNGTPIPTGLNDSQWSQATSGAYAVHPPDGLDGLDTDDEVMIAYGAYYNWYAVNHNNAQAICPVGWRVSTHEDWSQLTDYIIENHTGVVFETAGDALKTCRQINSPIGGDCDTQEHPRWEENAQYFGRDFYGFGAVPAGRRFTNGQYYELGNYGYWWTADEENENLAKHRVMYYDAGFVFDNHINKKNGFAVRCVRDAEIIEPEGYTLILQADPSHAGELSGAGVYEEGTEVSISASVNPGYLFVNWTDSTGIISETPDFAFNMPSADITLTAHFEADEQDNGETVSDIDGNVYPVIVFGSQKWMGKNLRVTKYNDGTPIATGHSNAEWAGLTTGAYAVYPHTAPPANGIDSDEQMVDAYGKLYNFYAVEDERGLCPVGWRVPTDGEWTALENYLVINYGEINNGNAANALKSCRQIESPLGGDCDTSEHPRWREHGTHYGTDLFGFNALPSGYRTSTGGYFNLGSSGAWWTSTAFGGLGTWYRSFFYLYGNFYTEIYNAKHGYSVRCIKDE
ncbi:MAG: hypothetical protein EA361_06305 [Bacteroidetes bacterium]|nr:MAG: hypothetical protein EA361_06305 [Bacteroidota bacterium]